MTTAAATVQSRPAPRTGLGSALLGLPLFLKVLVANVIVVLIGVGLGTWFTLTFVASPDGVHWPAVAVMLVVGFAASALINAAVLRLALQPLHALERTVDHVATGDLSARAHPVLFRDPDVERLGETLNSMLDVLQEHRQLLQKMSEQVLAAQEDERKRIARELHDETAQSLTTLLIRLKILEKARTSEEMHGQIDELRELTAQTLEAVRVLAVELRPTTLDDLGLLAALEAYTDSYRSRLPIDLTFSTAGFEDRDSRLPPQVELVLYRVVQEALTNVAKHARATEVHVELSRRPGAVIASITDDGEGFNVEEMMRSRERGLGLFGMQERLALVSGQLVIDSTPGHGTRITARVPLHLTGGLA
ncbi:MAG: HAMP domain-containing sensor histidine kinase [Chloroflexi bacterium]|nr:HAMP domain-containing sensor histidine kinase [Chloroflexota bacterium]MBV9600362.1 HAMP domain-containing sensor histidine kinase [Chloroflexota bacterium]